jgi:hypothetical protein
MSRRRDTVEVRPRLKARRERGLCFGSLTDFNRSFFVVRLLQGDSRATEYPLSQMTGEAKSIIASAMPVSFTIRAEGIFLTLEITLL